jgi:hypothetical protein
MKKPDRIGEREYQDRLHHLMKSAFNGQLQPLKSLRTVTQKRRALKKAPAETSGFTKSDTTRSG